jgi:hypothetical protein
MWVNHGKPYFIYVEQPQQYSYGMR